MEIKAIIRALLWIPPGTSATIVSDSRLAVKILSGDWRAKANRDLTEEALALIRDRQIEFRWVRGHAGDRWNERADALAAQGMAEVARTTGKRPRPRKVKTASDAEARRRADGA